jgi:hypothetical protein
MLGYLLVKDGVKPHFLMFVDIIETNRIKSRGEQRNEE